MTLDEAIEFLGQLYIITYDPIGNPSHPYTLANRDAHIVTSMDKGSLINFALCLRDVKEDC